MERFVNLKPTKPEEPVFKTAEEEVAISTAPLCLKCETIIRDDYIPSKINLPGTKKYTIYLHQECFDGAVEKGLICVTTDID